MGHEYVSNRPVRHLFLSGGRIAICVPTAILISRVPLSPAVGHRRYAHYGLVCPMTLTDDRESLSMPKFSTKE